MASSKTVTVGRVEALEGRVSEVEGSAEERVAEVAALRERVAALEEQMAALAASTPAKKEKKERAAPGAPKKAKKEKEPAAPLPEATEGAPDASAYRIPAEEIKEGVCVARIINDTDASRDRRWSPAVYRELQCAGAIAEGEEDLCEKCAARLAKFAEEPETYRKWYGRLTDEPLDWMHMLGTSWAEDAAASGKLKWRGEGAGDSASETSSASSAAAGGAKPGRKPAKSEDEKAAEKAAKEAEREAKKAEKAAEKEAEKAKKAAEKEAEKAKKAAEKEAEKQRKAAEKPKKAPAPKKTDAAPTPTPAPAAASAEPAATAFTLKMIDGELYALVGDDVFEYDSMEETRGDLVGRMEGETFVPKTEE
jgi:hypothetical protein